MPDTEAHTNTDREIWREREGDYYADSIHATQDGGIGINVGGTVIVMPAYEWHALALRQPAGVSEPITFWYRNYKGEEGYRRVMPISIRYGTSEWHKEPQWLLLAADLVNDKLREFAMKDISGMVGTPVLALLNRPQTSAHTGGESPK